jgi:hypothetical protein
MAKTKPKSPAKPKKVPYRLIEKKDSQFGGMYRILNDLIHAHHSHLRDARIALAWHKGWKADVDGRVKLGVCRKVGDLDRQLQDFDFVIVLNREFWTTPAITDAQKKALLDHELCHAQVVHDDNDDPAENELGQVLYRMRGHDVEEFGEIVERHGIWKRDLERFFQSARRGPSLDFEGKQSEVTKEEPTPKIKNPDEGTVAH